MSFLSKIRLYWYTSRHLKKSQILYRLWRKLGGLTPIHNPKHRITIANKPSINAIPALSQLDFDPIFLSRFNVDEIMNNQIELLHHSENVNWNESWHVSGVTPLWEFNLHYFEYLLPLAKSYIDTGNDCYLIKAKSIINSWIQCNPIRDKGAGWDPYVISLRTINWLAFYSELNTVLENDSDFVHAFNTSLKEQYEYLYNHMEKDLLGNHYLENLKAGIILACYFQDNDSINEILNELKSQVSIQILPDGMHYELSPMYHKIVLEDMVRIASTLRANNLDYHWMIPVLQKMGNCLYSMEKDANRTPLFNDSGDNVSKSKKSLLESLSLLFNIIPVYKESFPYAGYYIFEKMLDGHICKIIFDAGNPGPEYALGHAHCDALSFEVFFDGVPILVNCGTYAYQDEKRLWYKSDKSHSTVSIKGYDQNECWSSFRVARYGKVAFCKRDDNTIQAAFVNYKGVMIIRKITIIDKSIVIEDECEKGKTIESKFYFTLPIKGAEENSLYAPSFGMLQRSFCFSKKGEKGVSTVIKFEDEGIDVQ